MPTTVNTHPLTYIESVSTVHFTGALVTDAIEIENIAFPATSNIGFTNEILIESIFIKSVQNLDWDVFFFTNASVNSATIDLDTVLDRVLLPAASAKQIAGTGLFYYTTGYSVRYKDLDATKHLHVGLVNRSATSKIAGVTGGVVVLLTVCPIQGV